MADPITIKKKKLTIKSKKSIAAPQEAPTPGNQDALAATIKAEPVGADTPAAAPIMPNAPVAVAERKQPSYTLFAILALITLLMFVVILAIQWTEWTYLEPAFPHPIATGAVSAPV